MDFGTQTLDCQFLPFVAFVAFVPQHFSFITSVKFVHASRLFLSAILTAEEKQQKPAKTDTSKRQFSLPQSIVVYDGPGP